MISNETSNNIASQENDLFKNTIINQICDFRSDESVPSEKKIELLLDLGIKYYDLELGILSEIKEDIYKVIQCRPNGSLSVGKIFQYQDTYCSNTFGSKQVFTIHDAQNSPFSKLPCYLSLKLNSYIGTTIFVDYKPYGTVCFVKKAARKTCFTHADKAFILLIAQFISTTLEEQSTRDNVDD